MTEQTHDGSRAAAPDHHAAQGGRDGVHQGRRIADEQDGEGTRAQGAEAGTDGDEQSGEPEEAHHGERERIPAPPQPAR